MKTITIDTSNYDDLNASFLAAMRTQPDKIIFKGSAPQYEQRVKEAGIVVEVAALESEVMYAY